MTARTIRLSEAATLQTVVGEVLSQLELILPATEFTILVHVLVHVPAQLAWFGPAHTTWMFAFERSGSLFDTFSPLCSFFGFLCNLIYSRRLPEANLAKAVDYRDNIVQNIVKNIVKNIVISIE